ncbi:MAG TPA: AtpZ/AtpI family protein [Tepidisphaeraceae bacterium]|jgi:F0F1-type ATP synthase assembly protein I
MADGPAQPPRDRKTDDASVMKLVGAATTVGFEFVVTVLLPGALGYWLDGRFGTGPVLMILGGVFGFGVGLYRMLKLSASAMK